MDKKEDDSTYHRNIKDYKIEVQIKWKKSKLENLKEAKVILSKNLDHDYVASKNNHMCQDKFRLLESTVPNILKSQGSR